MKGHAGFALFNADAGSIQHATGPLNFMDAPVALVVLLCVIPILDIVSTFRKMSTNPDQAHSTSSGSGARWSSKVRT